MVMLQKGALSLVAPWLEILAEFKYQLRHRAGIRHGTADSLCRQKCEDCQQCLSIEKRDKELSAWEVELGTLDAMVRISTGTARF